MTIDALEQGKKIELEIIRLHTLKEEYVTMSELLDKSFGNNFPELLLGFHLCSPIPKIPMNIVKNYYAEQIVIIEKQIAQQETAFTALDGEWKQPQ